MTFLSFQELIDIVLMSLIIGYIFKDVFAPRLRFATPEEWLKNVTPRRGLGGLSDYWFAVLLVAPSIILHEFGHKLVAMWYGLQATFHAAYGWLFIAVLLKTFLPGFVFFVPAYVSYPGIATPFQSGMIALAGPLVNGLLWLLSRRMLGRRLGRGEERFWLLFRRINGFLFVLNLIPFPGFDGFHVLASLLRILF